MTSDQLVVSTHLSGLSDVFYLQRGVWCDVAKSNLCTSSAACYQQPSLTQPYCSLLTRAIFAASLIDYLFCNDRLIDLIGPYWSLSRSRLDFLFVNLTAVKSLVFNLLFRNAVQLASRVCVRPALNSSATSAIAWKLSWVFT